MIDPRTPVRETIGALFGSDRFPEERYDVPLGDPGLFGPDSETWRVHADVSMFVGGVAALLLQSLHPRAAAVVASSSRFREAPLHRLSRTGSFVAATTYAATPVADAIIGRVRDVHRRIPGASEPALLTWVHVAETSSFLAAYQRFNLVTVDADRYYEETAVVAEKLGAVDVPRSVAEVDAYFDAVRPELAAGDDSRELVAFLQRPLGRDLVTRSIYGLFVRAGMSQLPGWARRLHGMWSPPGADRLFVRPATFAALETMRLALGSSPVVRQSRERCAQTAA